MKLWITRPLPDKVIEATQTICDVEVRQETLPLTENELRHALTGFDMVLPTLGDVFSANIINELSEFRCRLLANFGVGYNHIDVAAAKARGIAVTNTPGAAPG
ncbi:MAG: D-glycerate dehydrogenase, partial [Pseudomonadota bacterium]